MSTWSKDELRKIAEADDLHISPFREDGETYGTPTWIWSVAVDDALYVRGYNGQKSSWYQAAVRQKAGRIIAAGMTKEVTVEPVNGPPMCLDPIAVRREFRMSQGCIEHCLFPIDQYISNAGINHSVFIEDLEMAQETGSEVAVAWAPFHNREG